MENRSFIGDMQWGTGSQGGLQDSGGTIVLVVEIQSNGGESHLGARLLSSGLGMLDVRNQSIVDFPWTLLLRERCWIGFVELRLSNISRV